MKNTNIKFVIGVILFTTGLILSSFGIRWLFFLGLSMVVVSGSFTIRQRAQSSSIIGWLVCIGAVAFLLWFSSFGAEKPPLVALASVWLAVTVEEFGAWRKSRKLT